MRLRPGTERRDAVPVGESPGRSGGESNEKVILRSPPLPPPAGPSPEFPIPRVGDAPPAASGAGRARETARRGEARARGPGGSHAVIAGLPEAELSASDAGALGRAGPRRGG